MTAPTSSDPHAFVTTQTVVETAPLVPEIPLRLASEVVPLWQATESEPEAMGLPPPYWAFAWAGGQALARYLLDNPETVAGKRVLDFAAGSGIQSIAAARAGAAEVTASEIDLFALAAIALNARLNDVHVASRSDNLIGLDEGWDVVLAGDVCYERPMAEAVLAWLRRLVARGALVLIGDPGRTYLPRSGLRRVTAYSVITSRELEDCDVRNAVVWQVGN